MLGRQHTTTRPADDKYAGGRGHRRCPDRNFDGDAELYTTTDGRQLRVVCASGRLANADPTNEHAMQAMPTTQPTPPNHAEPTTQASAAAAAALSPGRARRDDSKEALWSGQRTRFLIEKYKENFRNIDKKGGLR
ncbi:hypothetical protein HPB52_008568 [Rhipicephalus sanguineus]|uniref:Uncharacterized protein n=1 Tax=Rhipicephalus sanguineus TaxID=34632 RepID=A0A9D4PNC7_RHISA|nr:hypothetical protein HPB52_008568 [Rhipicephalus sanguineus]